jgi:hypothetical protein
MAYNINLTDGALLTTVSDGILDSSTCSMALVGKNYAGYGEYLNENNVHLLENGANTTAPSSPLVGQVWYDKTNNLLKVYNGSIFKSLSGAIAAASQPSSNVTGDLWWDTGDGQLKVYNGTSFTTVGPAFTSGEGTSGAIVDTITDTFGVSHVIVQMYVNNTRVGIWSKDAEFTPAASISGFASIKPGVNMSTAVTGAKFQGTATDADGLGGFTASQFLRSDQNDTTSGTLKVQNDTGLYVGVGDDARISVTGDNIFLSNNTEDGDVVFRVNDGGSVNTSVLTLDGATTNATFAANVTAGNISVGTGNVSIGNIVNNGANGVGNIGSSTGYFNTVFATATTALYADIAERFEADAVYAPGTVVQLGGKAEVTMCIEDASDEVFGVVSTRPAFTMNGGAGENDTHPAIAMAGRVPVQVTGEIKKGDRLVCAGEGRARRALPAEVTAFNVIGRALEDKTDNDLGTVEAIVKIS